MGITVMVWEDLKLNHGLLNLNYQTPEDALLVSDQSPNCSVYTGFFYRENGQSRSKTKPEYLKLPSTLYLDSK